MAEIKTALTSNIDEALKIDSAIYGEATSTSLNKGNVSSRESLQNISDQDTEENSKMSSPEDNSSDKKKKKRFSNLRKVVSNIASNRRNRHKQADLPEDSIGDAQNSLKESRSNKVFGRTSYSSGLSRMWNSLFPQKTSAEIIGERSNMKEGSSKTLGRLFRIGNPRPSVDEELPKSVTLGRKSASHSLGLDQFPKGSPSTSPSTNVKSSPVLPNSQTKTESVPIPT